MRQLALTTLSSTPTPAWAPMGPTWGSGPCPASDAGVRERLLCPAHRASKVPGTSHRLAGAQTGPGGSAAGGPQGCPGNPIPQLPADTSQVQLQALQGPPLAV